MTVSSSNSGRFMSTATTVLHTAPVGTAGEDDWDEGDEGDGIELEILAETRVLERADSADVAAVEV